MTSERIQRRIEQLLDEADGAVSRFEWETVLSCARAVLGFDPENGEAAAYIAAAERNLGFKTGQAAQAVGTGARPSGEMEAAPAPSSASTAPAFFASGRYTVKRFLGEGGKKRVYLAHDTTLARDVAFALIKTDGLDTEGRERITREAQAMGKLGTHPHVVSVFDMGSEGESPYLVTELMQGGDIEGLLEKAPEHRLTITDAVSLAVQVCRGLEFAHSHGLVHRDLKPGNVWLTADGTAKIGDFGLAVSLDRSRLTRAGMMVGTVSYMPPEQAMGGEVSPRSDLYSLGAMLYEMVTGRPPFVGEESVAIITQHLNVPPVSPTWHRPECPPGLEALILRLLEKDAAKRPASAGEVRQALEALERGFSPDGRQSQREHESRVTGETATAAQAGAANDNPLYRRTFVGREQELRQLQATFDGAVSGNGALVMVVGEPGIGKTAVCEQLATYVTVRGGKALVGHSYEEGSLSLPYLPFVEAIRSYILAREPDALKTELGSGATDLARIVSEVRDRVQVEVRAPGDPEDDRWRLYQAITGFLRNAATVHPLFILLEDLHWADRATLDLLVHLSRNLQGARLLLAGTYRDVEVDRSHPLSGTLAELRRASNFTRVPLRGLTVDEVHRMMCQLRGQDVPWSRAEAIYRQTEGNPLFIQEVLRYLVEEGLVVRQGDRWVRADDGAPDSGIPEGLRDVIGKRLSRLGVESNRILSVAAVVGRDFDVPVLQTVAGVGDEALTEALEEAVRVGVVESQSRPGIMRFRFTHAFFRQTLYEEIFTMRRVRLHQQVGRALEQLYGRRVEDHAAELAEHFSQSTEVEDGRKALAYSEMAALRASSVFAYSEAVRHLERALQVLEVLDPDDLGKQCDLLIALGTALNRAGEPGRVSEDVAPQAFALAESIGDRGRAFACARVALEALSRGDSVMAYRSPVYREWHERAGRHAARGTGEEAFARITKALMLIYTGEVVDGLQAADEALDLARRLDDPETLVDALQTAIRYRRPEEFETRLRLSREFLMLPHRGASSRTLARALWGSSFTLLLAGDREHAEQQWNEMEELALRSPDANAVLYPFFGQVARAFLDGRLEEAVRLAELYETRGGELVAGGFRRGNRHRLSMRPLVYLGRAGEAISQIEQQGDYQAGRAVALASAGRLAEAVALVRTGMTDSVPAGQQACFLEVATLARDRDLINALFGRLVPAAGLAGLTVAAPADLTCIARHLGAAATILGEPEQARAYYQQALEVAGRVRFRPEIALSRLQLAELLLEHYPGEGAEALEHLDFAIAEFREMKMQPALERALTHKGLLHA